MHSALWLQRLMAAVLEGGENAVRCAKWKNTTTVRSGPVLVYQLTRMIVITIWLVHSLILSKFS